MGWHILCKSGPERGILTMPLYHRSWRTCCKVHETHNNNNTMQAYFFAGHVFVIYEVILNTMTTVCATSTTPARQYEPTNPPACTPRDPREDVRALQIHTNEQSVVLSCEVHHRRLCASSDEDTVHKSTNTYSYYVISH